MYGEYSIDVEKLLIIREIQFQVTYGCVYEDVFYFRKELIIGSIYVICKNCHKSNTISQNYSGYLLENYSDYFI